MKKTALALLVSFTSLSVCVAQKPKKVTGATITANNGAAKLLPDLTFDLIPALAGGGNAYETVTGRPGAIKFPMSFIVKNIGNAVSKTFKVEVEILYQAPRTLVEVEQGVPAGAYNRGIRSEPVTVEAIEKGKDVLKNHAFIFPNFPEAAWGKRIRIIAHIVYPVYNGEILSSNNSSSPYEFDLVK